MKTNLPCDVILDMIPLVRDNVASNETTQIVQDHIETCESCKAEFHQLEIVPPHELNDKKTIHAIKKGIMLSGFMLLFAGALLGVALSFSAGMFYNFYIMPLVGALAFIFLKDKCYFGPIGVLIISYVWMLVQNIIESVESSGFTFEVFFYPIGFSIIYVCLNIVGILIAWLFWFAFKKERGIHIDKKKAST